MTGPQDETAAGAAGQGRLRASHADRDQVIDILKAAFVQGRVDKDELDVRVGQALASRTYADLAVVTADIPAGLAAAQPAPAPAQPAPAPARAQARKSIAERIKVASWSACVVILLAGLLAVAGTGNSAWLFLSVLGCLAAAVPASCATAEVSAQKRSPGQAPQGPPAGLGGQSSRRTAAASPAEPLPQIKRHTAEAAPRRHGPARGHHVNGPVAATPA